MILGMNEYLFHSDVLLCANSFLSVVCSKSVNKRMMTWNVLNLTLNIKFNIFFQLSF